MGIIGIVNGMNGGRGIRCLTEEGLAEKRRLERVGKRERGIHHNKNVSAERWYIEMERSLFAPENEGRYWDFATLSQEAPMP